jgi:ankyrin repeat protein
MDDYHDTRRTCHCTGVHLLKSMLLAITISNALIASPDLLKRKEIHFATKDADIEKLKAIFSKDPKQIRAMDALGRTPIFYARDPEVAKYLLQNGANISATDSARGTPLHDNVRHVPYIRFLLENGADINAENASGLTPLDYAVTNADAEDVVGYLLSKGGRLGVGTQYTKENLLRQLCHEDTLKRYVAIRRVSFLSIDEALPYLKSILVSDNSMDNRSWAMDAIYTLGSSSCVDGIWQYTKVADEGCKRHAYAVLLSFGEEQAIPFVIKDLTSKDLSCRSEMCRSLVSTKATLIIPDIIGIMESSRILGGGLGTNRNIRRDLIGCLASLNAAKSVPAFIRIALADDDFLSNAAVKALEKLKLAKSDVFISVFNDQLSRGREYDARDTLIALIRTGTGTDIDVILEMLQEDLPKKHEIIIEMNKFLDGKTWKRLNTDKIKGRHLKPLSRTLETISAQGDLDVTCSIDDDDSIMPNTYVNWITIRFALDCVIKRINDRKKVNLTYVIKNGGVAIVSTNDAVTYLRSALLSL